MATASLVPVSLTDADSNVAAGAYTDIDKTVASADGVTLDTVTNQFTNQSNGTQNGYFEFGITNAPGDFSSFTSIKLEVRARVTGGADLDVSVWRVAIEGTNAPSSADHYVEWSDMDDGAGFANRSFTDSAETPSASDIDGWTVRVWQQSWVQDKGPDGLNFEIDEIELTLIYDTSSNPEPAADALTITEQTPTRLVNHIVAPGIDALVITEETPTRVVNRTVQPGVDALTITEETPDPLLNHIASPAIDDLEFTGYSPVGGKLALPGIDALSISGQTPLALNGFNVAPTTVALTITEETPERLEKFISPSYYNMRVYSVVGLNFRGITPTISVSGGGDNTEEPGAGSLTITEETPTRLVNHIASPAIDELVITEETPDPLVNHNTAPAIDELNFGSSAVTKLEDHLVASDLSVDELTFGSTEPLIFVGFLTQPGIDELTISGLTPTKLEDHVIEFLNQASRQFLGRIPTRLVNHIVSPGADSLAITEETPDPLLNHIAAPAIDELAFGGDAPTIPDTGETVTPSYYNMRIYSRVGLHIDGLTPTVSVDGAAVNPGAGSLTISEQTPTRLGNTIESPGVQELTIGTDFVDPLVNHIESPAIDELAFGGDAPLLAINLVAGNPDALVLSGNTPTIPGSVTITAGNPDALVINSDAPTATAPLVVTPAADSLSLTGQTPLRSINLVEPSLATLTISGQAPGLAVEWDAGNPDALTVSGQSISGTEIANSGRAIVNPQATTSVPSNYEACDFTGFRQMPGSLKLTWNKYAVRRKSFESRHPQEGKRWPSEARRKGSKRPEQPDRFIGTDIDEITGDDL